MPVACVRGRKKISINSRVYLNLFQFFLSPLLRSCAHSWSLRVRMLGATHAAAHPEQPLPPPRVISAAELVTPSGEPYLATSPVDPPDAHFLGKGATGRVYAAQWRPAEAPGSSMPVAVKTVGLNDHSPEDVAKFRREAAVQAYVSHPHIAALYGVGEFALGGIPALHFVMELGSGGGLDALVQPGGELHRDTAALPLGSPARLARVTHLGAQAALGLLQAHACGFAHCDVKLANLILSSSGRVLVTDFGIAFRVRQGGRPLAPGGTLPGQRVQLGTFKYMPPENFEVCPGHTGQPPCDVYSLAFALLELAQGVLVPDPSLVEATAVLPPPGSALAALGIPCVGRNLRPRMPEAVHPRLAALIQDCWAPDPRARPPMVEVARQLLDVHSHAAAQEQAAGPASATLAALRAELEAARSAAALAVEAAARRAAADEAAAAAQLASALQAQAVNWARRVAAEEVKVLGARQAEAALQAELQAVRGAAAAAASGAAREREATAASLQQAEAAAAALRAQLALALAERGEAQARDARALLALQAELQAVRGAAAAVAGSAPGAGRIVSVSSRDQTLRVWDAASGQCLQVQEEHASLVLSMCALGDGRIVCGSQDYSLKLLEVTTGVCERVLSGHGNQVTSVCSLGNGLIVSGSWDQTLRVWRVATGECAHVLTGHTAGVTSVCALADGSIVSGSIDKTLIRWYFDTPIAESPADSPSLIDFFDYKGHTESVTSVCALGCGCFVSGSEDKSLRVWDVATKLCVRTLVGHAESVTSVCSLGGGRIVSGSEDSTLRVWGAATGECLHVLAGHASIVRSVCAVGGEFIVSGSEDKQLRVWSASTGMCVRVLEGHTKRVACVCLLDAAVLPPA
jgi:hypothetical protein